MFLFETIPWYSFVAWLIVLAFLLFMNEVARFNKACGVILFVVVPVVLHIFVWQKTSGMGSGAQTANWFAWLKTYSALIGCYIGFATRFNKKLQNGNAAKWLYVLPPAILAINIVEAVVRELEVMGMSAGVQEGMFYMGGTWNLLNAIAGILNILTISGWFGLVATKDRHHDLVWPDMMWFWIIAYDLWNFAYVYNCLTDRSFYSAALLISCTVPAFFFKKGAWAQHRVHTLAIYMMLQLTIPDFFIKSHYAVASTHNPVAYYTVSIIALVFNIGVFVYHWGRIIKLKKNPLTDCIYEDTKVFQEMREKNMNM